MKIFYVVGKNTSGPGITPPTWEFSGIFDDREKALKACVSEYYFIGPTLLNKSFPDQTTEWPGCYYPHLEEIKIFSGSELKKYLV